MSYKASKEAFVSGTSGSTLTHINALSSTALTSLALHAAIRTRFPREATLVHDFALLVLPLLLAQTVFAEVPGWFSLGLLVPTGLILCLPVREVGTPLPAGDTRSWENSAVKEKAERTGMSAATSTERTVPAGEAISPLPALTVYRSHMMLMTVLAILAVDFPIFPRMLAKCETYGVSLMDIGVGSFVFTQGIVSAIPLLKDPRYLHAPALPKILQVVRKTLPVLTLGLIRVALVKGTDYPEHETEYGRHWNFFITLALLPILQVILHPLIARVSVSVLGVAVITAHQFALSHLGLSDYVLSAPRSNLVAANKEGVVSLTGYLAIHLLGLSSGILILPPTPSFFRRQQQAEKRPKKADHTVPLSSPRENDKTAVELFSYTAIWWTLLGLTNLIGVGGGVSRRMVNAPYVLWVAAYNTSFLLGYLALDLYFAPARTVYSPTSGLKVQQRALPPRVLPAPGLLEAINRNSLFLFLLANMATGVVNLSMKTMYASNTRAMIVLSIYAFGVCTVAWVFRRRRLWRL